MELSEGNFKDNNHAEIEKRQFPRLYTSVKVDYSVIGRKDSEEDGFTKNVSAGGICLVVHDKIEVKTVLSLKITLPKKEGPIRAKGKVVWAKELARPSDPRMRYELGVEFIEIDADDRKVLFQYVF